MSVATLNAAANAPPDRTELVPRQFDPNLVVAPDGNPTYSPAMVADLVASIREHGQLVPGWVCPSPDLPEGKRLCLEGNRRREACLSLGLPFWAFDLGRVVPEAERIRLTFSHNFIRRRMRIEEIAERAARYIEITHCTAAEAAKHLNVSAATLSRAFGERRIPPELKPKAELLCLSIRSLIAALPVPLMAQAVEFAGTPGPDGKAPTRDQVPLFLRDLKKGGKTKARRAKAITLRMNGRAVTLAVGDKDSAYSVAEDLKAIVAKLGKHADVSPDGWPFLFAQ
jgi:ParB/RepB/Spo0J family partition protein